MFCKRFMTLVVAVCGLAVIHAGTGSDELINMG